ncbi:unnamed protein product [Leptosia nina]|uniref:F-box domain-containing protein n=1 Tax=Leptosia nina TaxID=320188 RepID=A0AAV1IU95_9NEOP
MNTFTMDKNCFEKLPPEILINILKLLSLKDLRNVMITSKYLKDLITNESSLWKFICRYKLIINHNNSIKESSKSWYTNCRLSHNWCKGIFKNKILIQNQTKFLPWMQLVHTNVLLVSFGSDLDCFSLEPPRYSKRLIWKINVPTTRRYDIRTNDVTRFIVKDNLIVCGNRDGNTAIYEYNNIREKPYLLHYIQNCHNCGKEEVTAVEKTKNCVITASNLSPYINLWNLKGNTLGSQLNNCSIVKNFEVPECDGCWSLSVDALGKNLAIGLNGNGMPACIDLNIGQYVMSPKQDLRGKKHLVRDLQWHNTNGIVFVTHSGKLQYIDTRVGSVTYEIRDPFQSALYCVKTDGDNAVVTGSAEYSRCVLFDLRSPHHVQMFFTQKKSSPIYSLDFDVKKLIAAGDQRVAVANFNVSSRSTEAKDYSQIFEFVSS